MEIAANDRTSVDPSTLGSRLPDNDAGEDSGGIWPEILERLGLGMSDAEALTARAATNRTCFQRELLASGIVSEETLFRTVAAALDIDYLDEIDPDRLILRERDFAMLLARPGGVQIARCDTTDGPSL